ncbi:PREDICTED: phosphatidylinositol 4-kinase alpha 1-like isoform X2 [Nelumbo nucifera]|uniref:1-phosphatidylinositol 4-kinase n=1 Tax=Nelumbo nucifera TaxID=4432 RepID=A0A1U7ZU68_NELNU|nr:PREDICTED: phosphatidylinositol 4-kinase alpha 1-like isoform X2 [Nelumbo nucifera]
MEALIELCDLISQNPAQFAGKLSWICSRCPPPGSLLAGSHRITRSQLNAVLAVARFLSKCSYEFDLRPKSVVIEFLRSIPDSFRQSFWPQSFGIEPISVFYSDFLGYIVEASELSADFAAEVADFMGEIIIAATTIVSDDVGISKAFLTAVSQNCPPILSSEAERLVCCLLDQFAVGSPSSPREAVPIASETSSTQSSPLAGNRFQVNESWSPGNEANNASGSSSSTTSKGADDATTASSRGTVVNGISIGWRSSVDQLGTSFGFNDGGEGGAAMLRQQVVIFEEETLEGLERQEVALRLLGHIVDKVPIKAGHLDQARIVAKKQLQSLSAFLKIRKRDWTEQGTPLRVRIVTKLSVFRAAAQLQIKSLASIDSDGKSSKKLLLETLALLIDAAEACLLSVWRKLRICEVLFNSLLSGISQIAVTRGGQLLRVLLIRLKPLVLTTCAQGDTWGNSQDAMFESVTKTSCEIIEFGWRKDRAPVDTFIMGLAASIRERNDYEEQGGKEKQAIPVIQLNAIRLLADLNVSVNKAEVVDMILPLFIESLEEGDASTPGLLRLRLLDAVARMASLGFEKSYRETVVLMTRSYLNKLSTIGSAESKTLAPEATTERVETLPAGFLLIATGLTNPKLRSDYRHRLLSLCSDVGLAAESKSGRSGADFLGPLLPAVAEICSDFDPTVDVEPSLLKLFRNLWFYVALFGLAPPIQKNQLSTRSVSTTMNSVGSMTTMSLQAVVGPYMWNSVWSAAIQRIAQGTPPLVVSSVKWLEDELELNALHNPGSRRGSGNEKAAVAQRAALSAALGGRVETAAMSTITGVKATYLLAVAFLEIIRFSSNGGILNGQTSLSASRSAFNCVFEYLKTPNLKQAVFQCLTAIVHRAFETAVSWLEDRISETGNEAEIRESTLSAHACFLIKNMSQREEHIRDISVSLLIQLRDRFPQILWNSSCLDSLLFSVNNDSSSSLVNDPTWVTTVRSLYQRVVREWISNALSYAPCTSQGLLQEKLCKANTWQRSEHTPDVVSLLSEMRIGTGKNDCWTGIRTANIPAVMAAAAAASGANLKLTEAFNLEVLSIGIVSATAKCNHAGEIAGMRRLYDSIGGFQTGTLSMGFGLGLGLQRLKSGESPKLSQPESESFNGILLSKFVQQLQQFVNAAEKGLEVDKTLFRETCSQATALLLSDLGSDSKSNLEGFSQLLRLLCWCPAYISTPDAMEIGIFVWTWLVSAAPQLGSLVLAELVDAWLWTIDTKRGLFASEVRYSGPAAKLKPHLVPGEPVLQPNKDPVEGIIAHRLWLGFFIDRFEVIRHQSVEQLLLLGRMLQGTMKFPWHFSCHPAASGTFFTAMLLGLKFCSCQSQRNLQNFKMGLQLLEDRIYRAALGWFAYEPEWYDTNNKNFAQSEAQSISVFVHYLLNERVDQSDSSLKGQGRENEGSLGDMKDHYHPIWGKMENYAVGREKRKQLLLMLCQHETDRLEVWAQPLNSKDNLSSRPKLSSEKWAEYARIAFSVDPRIALCLVSRFPTISSLKAEVTQLVQLHILDIRCIPEALPFFVTPKAVEENSVILQQLPHWAACSITQALEFLTPSYKGHPRVMAYVLRVLESYPPERVTFFMPQLVQALRYDEGKLVEGYLFRAAQRSDIFAHILIWHLQGETCAPESGKDASAGKNNAFQALLPVVRQRIIENFTPKACDLFQREFDFFDKVTSISGRLFPVPKEERRAGIRRELEKIEMEGEDLYLPTAPSKLVRGIQVDSGIPLQSAAKVPIMITFNVVDRDGGLNDIKPQACIFKVGDDCRQDVLALQVISLLRDIFEAVGLNLYLFPYGVLPTGPERGIIEVVPNSRSRSQMGETTDGGLYEIFQQDYGPVGSPNFEAARNNFIVSSAGYAVASLLLQPKDRHNGNLLFDNVGRLVHIDFGFILETSPGGNMRFESAQFKLSHEMTQLLDPSGVMKSETWAYFVRLCVKGYLAARRHMDGIINTVLLMVDSGLPCFRRGDPIGNLRKRFHPEMSEREAANFMIHTCNDAYNKWTTAGYDLIQYLQQGIEK